MGTPIVGLVGKPSAGKSTFFAAATMASVDINPRPFTTIKPNVGTGYVRVEDIGKEFGVKPTPRTGFIVGDIRYVPVKLIDVAGLIPGAHEGRGLGNQFLNDLNQAHVLIHVVDVSGSTDEEGNFIGYGKRDPAEDVKFLEEELNLWYVDVINRNLNKMRRLRRSGRDSKDILVEILSSFRVTESLAEWVVSSFGEIEAWSDADISAIAKHLREETKPIVIAANKADLPSAFENIERLKSMFKHVIPCSAEAELALRRAAKAGLIDYAPGASTFSVLKELNEEQKKALDSIKENVLSKYGSTGVQDALDYAIFKLLEYKAVFPAGSKLADKHGRVLPDCFLLEKDATVYDFAMNIHSDIAENLIYAIDVRTKRKLSKDYVLKHRDAIELVSAAKKR